MIRVGAYVPGEENASSFYRGWGPLSRLHKFNPDIEVKNIETGTWHHLFQYDVIFTNRPIHQDQLTLIKIAKACGKPVWIDIDDDFSCLPHDNPNWAAMKAQDVQDSYKECCALADVITVTTEALRKKVAELNQRTVVIPNAHDDLFLGPCNPSGPREKVIAWRGSNTHQNDLMFYKNEILAIAAEFPEWEWHFFGYYPFFLTEKMKHVFHRAMPIYEFFSAFSAVKPAVVMVPLADNEFNKSKSNIAWLEATHSGAITVAPWSLKGVLSYSSNDEFLYMIRLAIQNIEIAAEITSPVTASASHINEKLSLSKTNKVRAELVKALAK